MAISKKSKFFAASLSAAVTVSAVAPTLLAVELPEDSQNLQDNEKEALALLMEAGVVKGDADTGDFRPGESINRAEASVMLSAILELDVDNAPAADFPDVDQDAWYAKFVNAVAAEGIVVGDKEGNFNWDSSLTRAEFAQMVFKAYGLETATAELPFEDLAEDAWYTDAIATLYANDIIAGQTETTFGPNDSIRRVDTARLLAGADLEFGTYLQQFVEAADVAVESVDKVDGAQVTVTLAGVTGEIEAGDFTVTDSNDNTYAVVSVANGSEDGEYILNLGTKVEGKGTLTVAYADTEATAEFDTTLEGFTLGIEVADEDQTLAADGADNTVITIQALKDGELIENFKGSVKFQSLKGAKFAKEEVSFDKGIAEVQVNSISSATEILDTIIATISNAEDEALVGEQVRTNLRFLPASASEEVQKQVFVTYAESASASEVFVKFNDTVDFDQLRKDFFSTTNRNTAIFVSPRFDSPDATSISAVPTDIVKVDDTTVKLVFTADNALKDNAKINVQFIALDTKESVVQTSNVNFNLVDSKAPTAVGVEAFNYNTIVVEFNEAINNVETVTANASNWVLNGHQLTLDDIAEVKIGRPVNEEGRVDDYVTGTSTDNRSFATIKLNGADNDDNTTVGVELYRGAGKDNLLQAYNVEDYAALTDLTGQNVATTQEFVFETPAKPTAPTLSVEQQSPEQFKLAFSSKVERDEVLAADAFTVKRLNGYDANNKLKEAVTLELGTDYVITSHGDDKTFYLELTRDWTEILDTNAEGINYYTPGYNELHITLGENKVSSAITGANVAKGTFKETLELDATSPTFTAEQAVNADKELLSAVAVKMSEPVKLPEITFEGDTVAYDQGAVPTPTFEFISEDKKTTIEGEVTAINQADNAFTIVPKKELKAGKWTVVIRSISDDIGNTSSTLTQEVVIETAQAKVGTPIVKFAAAFNDADFDADGVDSDYVVIQYGTEMSLDAIRSNIYQINDKVLPEGVRITSTNYEYDTVNEISGTFVKIKLPSDFLAGATEGESAFSEPHILNINKALASEDGVAIEGLTELELTFNSYDSSQAINLDVSEVTELINK